MLAHRLRRWPNIKTTLVQHIVFAGKDLHVLDTGSPDHPGHPAPRTMTMTSLYFHNMPYVSDPAVTEMTEPADVPLVQDTPTTVTLVINVTNLASADPGNDIPEVTSPAENFVFQTILSDTDLTNTTGSVYISSVASILDSAVGLPAGSSVEFSATSTVTLSSAYCQDVHYLCVLLLTGTDASSANNVACKYIDGQKTCDPGQICFVIIVLRS